MKIILNDKEIEVQEGDNIYAGFDGEGLEEGECFINIGRNVDGKYVQVLELVYDNPNG